MLPRNRFFAVWREWFACRGFARLVFSNSKWVSMWFSIEHRISIIISVCAMQKERESLYIFQSSHIFSRTHAINGDRCGSKYRGVVWRSESVKPDAVWRYVDWHMLSVCTLMSETEFDAVKWKKSFDTTIAWGDKYMLILANFHIKAVFFTTLNISKIKKKCISVRLVQLETLLCNLC